MNPLRGSIICIAIKGLSVILLTMMLMACAGNPGQKKWAPEKRAQAHVALALDYLQRGKFDVAREELDLALSVDPRLDTAHHGKGLLYAQMGFVKEAKRSFSRAVDLNTANYVAMNDYGIYLCENREFRKGIGFLRRVKDKSDNQVQTNTLLGLGVCHFGAGDFVLARNYFRQVLEVAPQLPQALLPMAEIAYAENNYLSARAFVERYLDTSFVSERALVLAADTEIQLKDLETARQYAAQLRRLYPSSRKIDQYRFLLK